MSRYAIYGAGSLGTVLGAYITKNGGDIDLINRNRAHVEALNENGATVTGAVEFNVPVKVLLPDEMDGRYDVISREYSFLFRDRIGILAYAVTATRGWEWFDGVREKQWFKDFTEKVKKASNK